MKQSPELDGTGKGTGKVKFTLEQATKARRGRRGIAISFFNLGARWGE
jgi:hypothetical protein